MINFLDFGGRDDSTETLLLNLEKSKYHNGEKVKGYLTITSNKNTVFRAFGFTVEGKEETKITVREPYSNSSSSYSNEYRTKTFILLQMFSFSKIFWIFLMAIL
jgi:hypothetical protein